jgi:hypothetical protein
MNHKPLLIYFVILATLCAAFIVGAKMLGEQGLYLAQGYMLTPAIAALVTRLFFYAKKFKDANLRFGWLGDYGKFWLLSLGITALSYIFFVALGAIRLDLSGQAFLTRLSVQFAAAGQDMAASLPPGFTPQTMLLVYFIGGLTVFNILPGLITGFGEEFGHRGFMFPALYRIKPWVGILVGGLIWYAWHWPVMLIVCRWLVGRQPGWLDLPDGGGVLRWRGVYHPRFGSRRHARGTGSVSGQSGEPRGWLRR